jgi:hypothetical protein
MLHMDWPIPLTAPAFSSPPVVLVVTAPPQWRHSPNGQKGLPGRARCTGSSSGGRDVGGPGLTHLAGTDAFPRFSSKQPSCGSHHKHQTC